VRAYGVVSMFGPINLNFDDQQRGREMTMHRQTVAMVLAGILMTVAAAAQGVTVSGRITTASGQSVVGAAVRLAYESEITSKGAFTDGRGRYAIKNVAFGRYRMTVTCIGYEKKVIERVYVDKSTTLDVVLTETVIDKEVTVVTASRTQQKASEAPASVTVIEPRTIRESPRNTPVEHLRGVAGVDIAQKGIAQQDVNVRGFNNVFSGALMVLTDYRPSGVPSLRANIPYFVPASNEDIDRMELVRGPGSALYGPNAAQGVLNILTRSPFASKGTTLFVGAGERSLMQAGLRHANTIEETFGYKVSAQYFSADDWVYVDSTEQAARQHVLAAGALADTLRIGRRVNTHERFNVDIGLEYALSDDAIMRVTSGISQAINSIEMTDVGAANARDWRYMYVNAQFLVHDLYAQAFYNKSDAGNTYLLRTGNPIVDRSELLGGRLQHAWRPVDEVRLTYGIDFFATRPNTDGTINGANENDDNYSEVGGYLQGDVTILKDRLSALGAVRMDQHSVLDDPVLSPRLALLYRLDATNNLRVTFNQAFTTPSTTDLFLDLLSAGDAFGLGALDPAWGVGVWAAPGGRNGYTFDRVNGAPTFVSQFTSRTTRTTLGDAGANGVWQTLTQVLLPQLEASAPAAIRDLLRPFLEGVPVPTGLQGGLALLNPGATSAAERWIPVGVSDVTDVPKLKPTRTTTYEVGYQGVIDDKLRLAVDVYYSTVRDFISPLQIITPNVFLSAAQVSDYLKPHLKGALMQRGMSESEAEAAAVQYAALIGGAYAQVPVGTVSPREARHQGDIVLATRNYGEISYGGIDLGLTYELSTVWSVSASMSYITDNFFTKDEIGGVTDYALNAPRYKSSMGIMQRHADLGLNIGLQWRWVDAFRMNSGVFVGSVPAYHMVDLTAMYDVPGIEGLRINLAATNLLDHRVQQFVGAAQIGRLVQARVTYTF
jgi:outer membrane receptor for ferrienterochelin and colicins